jgi:Fur family ferric uptake transcriptional regulator
MGARRPVRRLASTRLGAATPVLSTRLDAAKIIQPHGRVTRARVRVLEMLLDAPHALSHGEIEAGLAGEISADRVTLYRILDWLVASGLAHRVRGEDRTWRFNAVVQGDDRHAHFHCSRCGQVFCLVDLQPLEAPRLPDGFRLERADLSLRGLCPACGKATDAT